MTVMVEPNGTMLIVPETEFENDFLKTNFKNSLTFFDMLEDGQSFVAVKPIRKGEK